MRGGIVTHFRFPLTKKQVPFLALYHKDVRRLFMKLPFIKAGEIVTTTVSGVR